MKTTHHTTKTVWVTRILIWTIRHQDLLAYHIRMYTWCAVAIILLLTLTQRISINIALYAILVFGSTIAVGIWIAIERRRTWLLQVNDPKLKQEIHLVMLNYIGNKTDLRNFPRRSSREVASKNIEQKKEFFPR